MYKKSINGTAIVRLKDSATIPLDEENIDYKEFLKWQDEGGIIADAMTTEEAAAADVEVHNAIIKQQLLDSDLTIIRALVENNKARIDAFKIEQSEKRKKLVPPGE